MNEEGFYQPKLFSFSGRLNRSRFVYYSVIVWIVVTIPIFFVLFVVKQTEELGGFRLIVTIAIAAIPFFIAVVYSLGMIKRRFNDMGYSGWWTILTLVPYLGGAVMMYIAFAASSDGSNAWGKLAQKSGNQKVLTVICAPIYALFCVASIFGNDGEAIGHFLRRLFG